MSELSSSAPQERKPAGALLLRTLAMPADTNPNGDIFGGWLMSQMDMGGAILAKELARGRVVTVAVDAITFLKPVAVGDVVCCYGECIKVGNSSLKIKLESLCRGVRNFSHVSLPAFWSYSTIFPHNSPAKVGPADSIGACVHLVYGRGALQKPVFDLNVPVADEHDGGEHQRVGA